MKLQLKITRKVLFEKYDAKYEVESFFISHFENCVLKTHNKYPNSIFYTKNNKVLFEEDKAVRCFWINHQEVWRLNKFLSTIFFCHLHF